MCYEKRDTEQARACFERDQGGEKMAEYGIPDCVILFAMATFLIWVVGFVWLN